MSPAISGYQSAALFDILWLENLHWDCIARE